MKTVKCAYLAIVSILGMWLLLAVFSATPVEAKLQYASKEKTACKTCHVKPAPKKDDNELNDVGKCYQRCEHKNLDQCKKDPVNTCKA